MVNEHYEGFVMAIFGLGNKKRTNTSYSDGYQSAADTFSASRHDLTVGDYANGVPNIRLSSAFNSFIKQIPMMLVLFAIGAILAFYATKDLKRKYKADGTLMVQLGDEYVYQPVGVEGGQNALQLTPDSIISKFSLMGQVMSLANAALPLKNSSTPMNGQLRLS